MVPMKGRSKLFPSLRAQLVTSTTLRGAQRSTSQHAFGGKESGLTSREVLRRVHKKLGDQSGRRTVADELGARLVRHRGALACIFEELLKSVTFIERHVRDANGVPTAALEKAVHSKELATTRQEIASKKNSASSKPFGHKVASIRKAFIQAVWGPLCTAINELS